MLCDRNFSGVSTSTDELLSNVHTDRVTVGKVFGLLKLYAKFRYNPVDMRSSLNSHCSSLISSLDTYRDSLTFIKRFIWCAAANPFPDQTVALICGETLGRLGDIYYFKVLCRSKKVKLHNLADVIP